ncbi:hypothetical protein [Janthinobacterium aquaticum]|uniref:hypothetical protein n=1 Tax=Janthinobacterium sp. FT58W TaxID=2654254 RepID=UPI001263E786|nr:hypothetical protein [Janthinobacterium sp. FT58W]KAB8042692.1 hypothetical protein GCM43_11495 [Janthinobacterium sp. FT58W]
MNWLVIGQVANVEGGSDILLGRSGQGAKIDWRNGDVRLVNPKLAEVFEDFLAVERWLVRNDMLPLQEAEPRPAAPAPAPESVAESVAPPVATMDDVPPAGIETLLTFQQRVDACLQQGEGGQELLETKQAFEAGSDSYLAASNELAGAALEMGVAPGMVAMFHISAFAAMAEQKDEDSLARAAASLQAAATRMRADAQSVPTVAA